MRWNGYPNNEGYSDRFAMAVVGSDDPPKGKHKLHELRLYAKKLGKEIDVYYRVTGKFVWGYRIGADGVARKKIKIQ